MLWVDIITLRWCCRISSNPRAIAPDLPPFRLGVEKAWLRVQGYGKACPLFVPNIYLKVEQSLCYGRVCFRLKWLRGSFLILVIKKLSLFRRSVFCLANFNITDWEKLLALQILSDNVFDDALDLKRFWLRYTLWISSVIYQWTKE